MICDFLKDRYFSQRIPGSVSVEDTKKKMKDAGMSKALSMFGSYIASPNSKIYVTAYDKNDNLINNLQYPLGMFRNVRQGDYPMESGIEVLFMNIMRFVGKREYNGRSDLQKTLIFMTDPDLYTDPATALFVIDKDDFNPRCSTNLTRTGFTSFKYTGTEPEDLARRWNDGTVDLWESYCNRGSNGEYNIRFIYTPSYYMPVSYPVESLFYLDVFFAVMKKLYPGSVRGGRPAWSTYSSDTDTDYGTRQIFILFEYTIKNEFERAKKHGTKPSIFRIFHNALTLHANFDDFMKNLDYDLKLLSDIFSYQPVFDSEFGVNIKFNLSAELQLFPSAELDSSGVIPGAIKGRIDPDIFIEGSDLLSPVGTYPYGVVGKTS